MRKILVGKNGELVIPKNIMLTYVDLACINLLIRDEKNQWGTQTLFYNGDTGEELNSSSIARDNVYLIKAAVSHMPPYEKNNDVAIIEIPDIVKWEVKDDGYEEWVEEIHRKWKI